MQCTLTHTFLSMWYRCCRFGSGKNSQQHWFINGNTMWTLVRFHLIRSCPGHLKIYVIALGTTQTHTYTHVVHYIQQFQSDSHKKRKKVNTWADRYWGSFLNCIIEWFLLTKFRVEYFICVVWQIHFHWIYHTPFHLNR